MSLINDPSFLDRDLGSTNGCVVRFGHSTNTKSIILSCTGTIAVNYLYAPAGERKTDEYTDIDKQEILIDTLEGTPVYVIGSVTYLKAATPLDTIDIRSLRSLESLDLSGLTTLTGINIFGCRKLESLNLSGCTSLQTLNLSENTELQTLDLSGCTHLVALNLETNKKLQAVDLTNCSALSYLDATMLTELQSLELDGTQLMSPDNTLLLIQACYGGDVIAAKEAADRAEATLKELKHAIEDLPDGQAVSATVAEHTVALSKLHILTVDEMDTLGNYCTSLADLSEKYSIINLTWTDAGKTVVCASILPSTDSEHGWLYEFQEGWRICKMNEYEFYAENDFLDLASYMDGHSTRIATKAETGEPSDLTTEDKSSIVAGVNEVNRKVTELDEKTGDFNSQTYLESTTPEDFFESLITYFSPIPVTISGNSFSTNNTSGANKTVQVTITQENLVVGKEYKMYFKSTGYAINGLYVGSTLIANAVKEGDYYTFIWTHRIGTLVFSVRHPYNVTLASVSDIVIYDNDFVSQTFIAPSKLHNIGKEQLTDEFRSSLPNENYPTDYSKGDIGIFTKCLCVGDSLTAGVFNRVGGFETIRKYSYPSKLKAISGIDTTNLGDGGKTSTQWYDAHINDDLSGHDFAIIQLGVNDALQNGGWTNDSKVAFTNIINKIKTQNNKIKIFVATIIPATSYSGSAYDSVSEGIRNLVAELADTNVICLDMATYGHTKASSAYNCGHLSAYGYWRLAKDYYNYISWYIANHQSEFREVQFIGTNYTYE